MKESFPTTYSKHCCGGPLRVCNTCNRHFCTQCEGNLCTAYQKKGLKDCCRKAIVEYWTKKDEEELVRKIKTETKITDISDGKL